jgi:hypothetical protein
MPQSERYCRAARFPDQPSSESPYLQLQDLVFESDSDLSVFRFQLDNIWHIAVLGDHPGEDIDRRLEQLVSLGQATELDSDMLDFLFR